MSKTIAQLHSLSNQVKTANEGENTRERVGGLFEDIVDWLEDNQGSSSEVSLNQPLSSINNAGLGIPSIGQVLMYSSVGWIYATPSSGGGSGTLSSIGISMPTGFTVGNSPLTSDGVLNVGFSSGYSLLRDTDKAAWNAAVTKLNSTTWWGRTIQDQSVSGPLSGGIEYIEFSNGVRIGIDAESNTLRVYTSGGTEAHFYSTGSLSALGLGSGGGSDPGVSLLEPLLSLNGLGTPSGNNKILVYNNGWQYTNLPSGGSSIQLGVLLSSLNSMGNPGSSQSGYGLVWNGSAWTFADVSGSGGGGSSVILNNLLSSLNSSSLNTPGSSETGKTIVWSGSSWKYDTFVTSVPSWAMEATKPSYSWNEINDKPSWIGNDRPSYSWSDISNKPSWISINKPSYTFSELGGSISTSQLPSIPFAKLPTMYWANIAVSDSSSTTTYPTFDKIKIGEGIIEWDSTNNGFKLTGGLYTDSFLTALGIASSSSIYSISGDRRFTDKLYLGNNNVYLSSAIRSGTSTDGVLLLNADYIQFGNPAYRGFITMDDSGLTIESGTNEIYLECSVINLCGDVHLDNHAIHEVSSLAATTVDSTNIRATSQVRIGDNNHYLYKSGNDLYWHDGTNNIKLN